MSRNQCLVRYGQCPCDLYIRCCMWFPCISTPLSALRRTEVRTLSRIPVFTQISWQAFSTRCCNTSKSLIGAKYTKIFRCPPQLHPIHSSPKVGVRCCLTMPRKWGGAPSCMNHVCCRRWRGACSKSTDKSLTKKRRYTAPVSFLGKTAGPKSWSS
jgi:hypothetical protein